MATRTKPAPAAQAATNGKGPDLVLAMLAVAEIIPAEDNLRRDLDDIEGLAASITSVGIIEPLVVERCLHDPLHGYHLVAGHRRRAAAIKAGLDTVPCLIREPVEEQERVALYLIENLQRRDLPPLDEATGYRRLVELGKTQREIAGAVGYSQSHVSKRLALLSLPPAQQADMAKGKLTVEAAVALTRLVDHPAELKAAAEDYNPVAAVKRTEEHLARKAKIAKLIGDAKARGQAVRKEVRYGEKRTYRLLGPDRYGDLGNDRINVDPNLHYPEPCHGVLEPMLQYGNLPDSESLVEICVDPARHGKGGASTLKTAPKPKRKPDTWAVARQKEKQLRKEAEAARHAFTASALAGLKVKSPTDPVLVRAARSLLAGTYYETAALARTFLSLETSTAHVLEDRAAILAAAEKDLGRAIVAVAAALADRALFSHSQAEYGCVEHFAWLRSLGYVPTPWEEQQLAELEEALKEEAEYSAEISAMPTDPSERPEGAVAWYVGYSADDPPRWLTDEDEAETLRDLYPDRVVDAPPSDAGGITPEQTRACLLHPDGPEDDARDYSDTELEAAGLAICPVCTGAPLPDGCTNCDNRGVIDLRGEQPELEVS